MKKIISTMLIFVMLIQLTSAYTYLNIYIDETGEALFLGETNEQFSLPQNIEIKGKDIIGKTQSLTNKQGELWSFSYSLQGAEFYIVLPKGSVIKEISDGEISVKNKQISIYSKDRIEVSYIIEKENKFNYWTILPLILIITLGFYFYRLMYNKKKEKKADKKSNLEIIKQTLNEREKKIIDKLKEVGEIKHSRLQKLLDIPKASFFRHIQELEKKKIIKRTGDGKNKILSLK